MSNDDFITLGVSKMGNTIQIPARQAPRLAICGASGSGKSVLLNNILTQYMQKLRSEHGSQVVFHALDPKITSLAHLSARLDVYETEPANFLSRIQDFETVMSQRFAAMRDMGVSSLGADELDSYAMHILVLEEALSIIHNDEVSKDASKKIMQLYETVFTRCRAANMGVIMVSHQFSAECLPTVARDQLNTRVIMQTSSSAAVSMLADPEEAPAHLIKNAGEFYFIAGAGAAPIRAKCWHTSETEARAIADSLAMDKKDSASVWTVEKPSD